MLSALLLAALVALSPIPPPIAAGGGCHISDVVPIVTDWTITSEPGLIVVDARLARRPGLYNYSPAATYMAKDGASWGLGMFVHRVGEPGPWPDLTFPDATVTDSTFHVEHPYPAGVYEYSAAVNGGYPGEPDRCSAPYTLDGTLTVLPDPSPAARVSFGALKARWVR